MPDPNEPPLRQTSRKYLGPHGELYSRPPRRWARRIIVAIILLLFALCLAKLGLFDRNDGHSASNRPAGTDWVGP